MLPGKFEIDFPPMALITKINYGNLLPGKTHFSLSTMFLIPGNKKRRKKNPSDFFSAAFHPTFKSGDRVRLFDDASRVESSTKCLQTNTFNFATSFRLYRSFAFVCEKKNEAAPLLDTEIMTKASAPFIK